MRARYRDHLAALPQTASAGYPHGTPFVQALAHGSLRVELFAPSTSGLGKDIQQPHAQDELYVVQSGQSDFVLEGRSDPVQAGDVLFVPAGANHRFENFSSGFVTWVVFYGPTGGEVA